MTHDITQIKCAAYQLDIALPQIDRRDHPTGAREPFMALADVNAGRQGDAGGEIRLEVMCRENGFPASLADSSFRD